MSDMWGSFLAWRTSDGASPFLGKGQQPVLVRACCGLVSKRSEGRGLCRRRDLSTATLLLWARHLLSPEDLRKRGEHLRNLRRETPERQVKKGRSKRRKRPPRYRYSVRTDSGPIALRAFWSMHIEAMNFSGVGHAEYAAALGLRRTRCAYGAIASKNPATKWTGDCCFIRGPGLN